MEPIQMNQENLLAAVPVQTHRYEEPKDADDTCSVDSNNTSVGCTVWRPFVVLILLMSMNFLTYIDRGALNACLTRIKTDHVIAPKQALTGLESGALVSAFMVGYMVTCPLFVHLQSFLRPTKIMAMGLLTWIVALVMTAFSMNYIFLIASRALVGIGEAAYVGFTATIIDDMAPKSSRTMWLAGFFAMIPVGQAAGTAFGGVLSSHEILGYQGWRAVFVIQATLMFPILGCIFSLPDRFNPKEVRSKNKEDTSQLMKKLAPVNVEGVSLNKDVRGATQPAEISENDGNKASPLIQKDSTAAIPNGLESYTPLRGLIKLMTNGAYVAIVLGYAFYTFTLGALAVWTVDYLVEGPLRMSVTNASLSFGMSTLVTGVLGTVIGGKSIDWLGGSAGYSGAIKCTLFNAVSVFLSMPFGYASLFSHHVLYFFLAFVPAELFLFNTTAPVNAAIISVVPIALRTHAMSYSVFIIHALGDFPSAIAAGYLNDVFSFGCNAQLTMDTCTTKAANCYWKRPEDAANGICINKYQLRNSLLVMVTVTALPTLAWLLAWPLIKREKRINAERLVLNTTTSDCD